MNASKENARKALPYVDMLAAQDVLEPGSPEEAGRDEHLASMGHARKFLIEFLTAAERKLPSEAAYTRDRQRRTKNSSPA